MTARSPSTRPGTPLEPDTPQHCLSTSGVDRRKRDARLLWVARIAGGAGIGTLLLVLLFLGWESLPAIRNIGMERFATDSAWRPASTSTPQFLITPMLYGTLAVMIGAVGVAAPCGLGLAIFCRLYAPSWAGGLVLRFVEVLAGIPSVVFGFWGLTVVAPWIAQWQPPGASLLTGALTLALMLFPMMVVLMVAAFDSVPEESLLAAHTLGLSKTCMLRIELLPRCLPAIRSAVVLQAGRAVGETMVVLMTCGNIVQGPRGLLAPVRTLSANIALEMAYAMGTHRSALFFTGATLMLLVCLAEVAMRPNRWRPDR